MEKLEFVTNCINEANICGALHSHKLSECVAASTAAAIHFSILLIVV